MGPYFFKGLQQAFAIKSGEGYFEPREEQIEIPPIEHPVDASSLFEVENGRQFFKTFFGERSFRGL